MKVIYLGINQVIHPWFDDFATAIDGRHEAILVDKEKPLKELFEGVEAVVDHGGAVGTIPMYDEGARVGVKLWQVHGTGLDHVDVASMLERGLVVANTPGQFSSIALAEHAFFMMLHFNKNYHGGQEVIRSGRMCQPLSGELCGKTLGLIGFGASARELARRAKSFGMRLMAIDIYDLAESDQKEYGLDYYGKPDQLDDVLAESDFLSLHTYLTDETRNMIGSRELSIMKPTAVLINVARGELVDEDALLSALQGGEIHAAGLDVFAQEPIDPNHPLLQMDNVLATPHIAGGSEGTSRRRARVCADNVDRVAQGLPPNFQITSVP